MRLATRLGLVAILLPGLALVGCSVHKPSHQRLATQAIGFNLTVEEAQNEMLLLNVIRAKDRLPMYLTAISSLNGNVSTRLAGGLGGSYSGANADGATVQTASGGSLPAAMSTVTDAMTKTITRGLTPSVGGELSRNPNFTLAVLDGEKFMRGFLAPISQATFAYFWDQGWPPELLLYLLVQRVEEEGGNVFNNYPPRPQELSAFAVWVREFIARKPRVVRRQVGHDLGGPALPTSAVGALPDLVAAAKEGFVVTERGTGWHLQRRTSELYFSLGKEDKALQDGEHDPPGAMRIYSAGTPEDSESSGDRFPGGRLILRSPEAVLYYLGELMRVGDEASASVPHICIQGEHQPLFLAVGLGSCPRALVEARSPWGDYAIPPANRERPKPDVTCQAGELTYPEVADTCDSGRSMQALRLLSQLISLQKSSDELPSPALVRVLSD